jgi:hypothetical protein
MADGRCKIVRFVTPVFRRGYARMSAEDCNDALEDEKVLYESVELAA